MTMIFTEHMKICPMTKDELLKKIDLTTDKDEREAYKEMLAGGENNPVDEWVWNVPWKMVYDRNNEEIGSLGFRGAPENHAVEVGYGIEKSYEGKGLMTEAVGAILEWAFEQKDVLVVEAEAAPENKASQRILEKLHFVRNGMGEEGYRFKLEKK